MLDQLDNFSKILFENFQLSWMSLVDRNMFHAC